MKYWMSFPLFLLWLTDKTDWADKHKRWHKQTILHNVLRVILLDEQTQNMIYVRICYVPTVFSKIIVLEHSHVDLSSEY